MTVLVYLIPLALLLGLGALFAFLWALKSGQYEDLEGEASRILFDEDQPPPAAKQPQPPAEEKPKDQ
jgi:cbb3-type cytochrome oxidase maturation protein